MDLKKKKKVSASKYILHNRWGSTEIISLFKWKHDNMLLVYILPWIFDSWQIKAATRVRTGWTVNLRPSRNVWFSWLEGPHSDVTLTSSIPGYFLHDVVVPYPV